MIKCPFKQRGIFTFSVKTLSMIIRNHYLTLSGSIYDSYSIHILHPEFIT